MKLKMFPLFLLLFLSNTPSFASKIDSLNTELNKTTAPKHKLKLLKQLVLETQQSSSEAFSTFYLKLVKIAKEENDNYSLADAYNSKGLNFYNENTLDSSAFYFQKSSDLYKSLNQLNDAYLNLCKVGVMKMNSGYLAEAQDIYLHILEETIVDSLRPSRAKASLNLGSVFFRKKDYDAAEKYYGQSLSIYKDLKDSSNMVIPMNNLAAIYYYQKDDDKSFAMLKQLLTYHKNRGNKEKLIFVYNNLSAFHKMKHDIKKAMQYAQHGYEIAEEINDKRIMVNLLLQISDLFRLNDEHEKALKYIDQAIEFNGKENLVQLANLLYSKVEILHHLKRTDEVILILEEAINKVSVHEDLHKELVQLNISLADSYLEINDLQKAKSIVSKMEYDTTIDSYQKDRLLQTLAQVYHQDGNHAKAIKYAELGFKSASTSKHLLQGQFFSELLVSSYEKINNYEKALYYSKEYKTVSDSIKNTDNVRDLAQQAKDFEFEQEKKILAEAQAKEEAILKAETIQTRYIAGGIGILALLSFLFFLNSRRKNNIITQQNERLEDLNKVKDQIFAIIGHDLRKPALAFNGISKKVNYLLQKKDYESLDKLGNQIESNGFSLQKIIDNLLNWSLAQRDIIPYTPEAVDIKNILGELISIFTPRAKEKSIKMINNISTNQEVWSDRNALFTVLLNLLDNAIKYTEEGGEIFLDSEQLDGQVKISITDSGQGMSEQNINELFLLAKDKSTKGTSGEKGTGLGLHIANELIKINKGIIEVKSKMGSGSTFSVSLPVRA